MSAVIDLHVPDLEARILPGLEAVEDRLRQAVSHSRDLVTELTSHLAQAGGKRMRPLLTLVAAQFGDPERALSNEVLTAATGLALPRRCHGFCAHPQGRSLGSTSVGE